jgi:hypothetical protein
MWYEYNFIMATNSREARSTAAAAADTELEGRAKKCGIDLNAKEAEDDLNPDRVFTFRYKPYLEPKDADSVEETERVDAENKVRYEYNTTQIPLIQHALKRMACNWKIPKPPIYGDRARLLYTQRINEPAFKTLEAIKFCHARGKTLFKDYDDPVKAITLALELSDAAWLASAKKRAETNPAYRIAIRDAPGVPKNHHEVCNCNYTWNGVTPHCAGTPRDLLRRLRITWRSKDDHHFLQPSYEAFSY